MRWSKACIYRKWQNKKGIDSIKFVFSFCLFEKKGKKRIRILCNLATNIVKNVLYFNHERYSVNFDSIHSPFFCCSCFTKQKILLHNIFDGNTIQYKTYLQHLPNRLPEIYKDNLWIFMENKMKKEQNKKHIHTKTIMDKRHNEQIVDGVM